jgi:hypothetical protein
VKEAFGMPTFNPVAASDLLFTIMSGVHPDATELQTLVSFANQQYAYGQQIGVMDPFVYAYEALGAALSQQNSSTLVLSQDRRPIRPRT